MKASRVLVILGLIVAILSGCRQGQQLSATDKTVIAENDSVAILYQVVDSAKDDFDVPVVAIWIKNKTTNQEMKLYQTIKPDRYCWYVADGDEFIPVSLDSLYVTRDVTIYKNDPLQLIVQGCPDMRNEFTYLIDVSTRKAWYVPSNFGYVGNTLEGYMIFESYRYVSNPDVAGRYSFLQVFNEKGEKVDTLNLEHVRLEEYEAYKETED